MYVLLSTQFSSAGYNNSVISLLNDAESVRFLFCFTVFLMSMIIEQEQVSNCLHVSLEFESYNALLYIRANKRKKNKQTWDSVQRSDNLQQF